MAGRIRDWGLVPGRIETGKNNSITDVPGVKVGHCTINDKKHRTGVTVIIPRDDIYYNRCTAACEIINGFGKTAGLGQIDELGQIETPIALTNTLNVGLVFDALVEYTEHVCKEHGEKLRSVNPVVGECNDGSLNHIKERVIGFDEVMKAFDDAETNGGFVQEGSVGAGTGMICHGLKGGIGTASRKIITEEGEYVIGMLALCNHGCLEELNILGKKPGDEIKRRMDFLVKPDDSGSCVMVLATNLPLSSRQLKRVVRRSAAGLARCGSYWGHGSGDVAIGFTTAHDNIRNEENTIVSRTIFNEDKLNIAFAAAAECAEECVLNALTAAETVKTCFSLSEFRDLLQMT